MKSFALRIQKQKLIRTEISTVLYVYILLSEAYPSQSNVTIITFFSVKEKQRTLILKAAAPSPPNTTSKAKRIRKFIPQTNLKADEDKK